MTVNHSKRGTMAALQMIRKKSGIKSVDDYKDHTTANSNEIIAINPEEACNWSLHDRQPFELGNIEELSEDLKNNGQQQPAIVRFYNGKDFKYEIIAGERRWHAAKLAKIPLLVIVKSLTEEEAAFCQISENSNRNELSDYSRGINYKKLIEQGIVSQKQLEQKLNKSKASVSELLSFADIPQEVISAIGDMSKVTSRTSATIRAYINKGEEFKNIIIQLAPRIKAGIGAAKLQQLIKTAMEYPQKVGKKIVKSKEVISVEGTKLFTSVKNHNSLLLTFDKDILDKINLSEIEEIIKTHVLSYKTNI